jgi:SulP family sulfate permease
MTPPSTAGTLDAHGIRRYLPILRWLPAYDRSGLSADLLAGLSVWALLVPQSLAYSALAGVPVQYGLYTAFAALVVYALFGTSRQMTVGPSSTVAAVTAAVITPLVGANAMGSDQAASYAAALALAVGAVYLVLGVLRMGWVSNFLSKSVLGGFILGFAIGIIVNQSSSVIGVAGAEGSYAEQFVQIILELPTISWPTFAVGVASLALLLVLRQLAPKVPRALIVVVLSIVAVVALDLTSHGVEVTGDVPTGLFSIGLPGIGGGQLGPLLTGALAVIFVGFSESLASARMMASKHDYDIDADQELIAQGAACSAAGLVGGYAVDGSLSKTSVGDAAGMQSQIASVFNAIFILLTMLFLAGLFANLPTATLGAVVIDSMVGLITLEDMRRYRRVNRADWVFFIGAMLGMLFLGIIQGILIGVVLSLLLLIARASRPPLRELGREPATDAFHDLKYHDGLEVTPGVLVARIDGPLFFANANRIRDGVTALVRHADAPVRTVVLDMEAVSQTDTDGADVLAQLTEELRARDITVGIARVEHDVQQLWQRAGAIDVVGADHLFTSIHDAVDTLAPAGIAPPTRRRPVEQ